MSILVENLTKIYGSQKAVDSISFSIDAGEIVGFLGPNGAGKSTTMKILSGFIPASSGTAEVLGLDVSKNELEVKRKIGYLPELNPLYNDMYVSEYLQFNANMYRIKNAKEEINRIIDVTGLTLERKKKIGQLSKGYKQRVGIAQALINDPDVLILDEPTSGLDPNQMTEIRQLIVSLGKDKTILLSTHIMQEVEAMCNRVIIINNGKIVADDDVTSLKSIIGNESNAMIVRFRDDISINDLRKQKGIESVKERINNSFEIVASEKVNLPEVLFKYALENNTIILEQKEVSSSLESVFQRLTKDV
ncbi:MAG: ATP-binding cassette domain-containing protein [Bacteroidia bacterium]|nr:ATP-binding cassette domain-containing protein [Bacteroidia bacterium]